MSALCALKVLKCNGGIHDARMVDESSEDPHEQLTQFEHLLPHSTTTKFGLLLLHTCQLLLLLLLLLLMALQEAAVSSISLESSQEELSTLITLWELQPFTHEEAVASLLAAAAKEES